MSRVAVVKCKDYDEERVRDAVVKAVSLLGGIEQFVGGASNLLVKPNLLVAKKPEKAVSTHPSVLKAVLGLAKPVADKVLVGDSPGFGNLDRIAAVTGIIDAVNDTGAELVHFTPSVDVATPDCTRLKRMTLAKPAVDADAIISVPKLKTHGQMYFTGAVKNQFGCIPGLLKPQMHLRFTDRNDFATMLLDINRFLKPKLAVMDGVVGMDGMGPSGGSPKPIGVIIAGGDLTAVDVVACSIVGIDPKTVPTIAVAAEQGYGCTSLDEIEVVGDPIESVRVTDFNRVKTVIDISAFVPVPDFVRRWLRNSIIPKPVFGSPACTLCEACVEVCPAQPKAIKRGDDRIEVDYSSCIRCYCCHEMCPQKAIELRAGVLGRLLNR